MPRKRVSDAAGAVRDMSFIPKPKGPKRNRDWEKQQRNAADTTQVSFRGIPRGINDRIKELAQERGLTVSEVARWLLEWGLEELESERRELP